MNQKDSETTEVTPKTSNRLFSLSNNECAFSHNGIDCRVKLARVDSLDLKAHKCHIEAKKEGEARYNSNSNNDYRRSFENLILLCPNHHTEIDSNVNVFTVNVLQKMKRTHEAKMLHKNCQQNIIKNYPSVLSDVISALGSRLFNEDQTDDLITAPDPEEKIAYNNISEYKPIIDSHKVYQGRLNTIYREIENQGSVKKELVLKNINTLYLREKGKYANFDEIKNNADNIFRNIETEMWAIIENSSNRNDEMPYEAIQMSILIIMVDAFMRCEILEEPKRNDS